MIELLLVISLKYQTYHNYRELNGVGMKRTACDIVQWKHLEMWIIVLE